MAKADFLLVAGRARALEPLMAARAGQGAARADEIAFAAEVSLPQGERNQLTHLNRQDRFFDR
jgi:hypothetical protein